MCNMTYYILENAECKSCSDKLAHDICDVPVCQMLPGYSLIFADY